LEVKTIGGTISHEEASCGWCVSNPTIPNEASSFQLPCE